MTTTNKEKEKASPEATQTGTTNRSRHMDDWSYRALVARIRHGQLAFRLVRAISKSPSLADTRHFKEMRRLRSKKAFES